MKTMARTLTLALLIALTACARRENVLLAKPQDGTEQRTILGYSVQRLGKLSFEDIKASPELFADLFVLAGTQELIEDDVDICIEVYHVRDLELRWFENFPSAIYVVMGKGRRIMLPRRLPPPDATIDFRVSEKPPRILCLSDSTGGNCWNCSMWPVFSLEQDSFLELVGEVAEVEKRDDGGLDLYRLEDVWESGLDWFCHADAPSAKIYYHVEKGALAPDTQRNAAYWKEQVEALDKEIGDLVSKHSRDTDLQAQDLRFGVYNPLLRAALLKFLHYRLLGDPKTGWSELHKDLLAACDEQGRVPTLFLKHKLEMTPVDEIERKVRESLDRNRTKPPSATVSVPASS